MTISLEQHIEELRAELRNCPIKKERREIEADLKAALAELDARLEKIDREMREFDRSAQVPPS